MELTKEFEVGDRVYWEGNEYYMGGYGVITRIINDDSVYVLWDYGGEEFLALVYELQHEQPKDTSEEHPITFYNIQDDIPIGGFAKVGNEVYKVVKADFCVNCDLEYRGQCSKAQCISEDRHDGVGVSLILYDTIPEYNDE